MVLQANFFLYCLLSHAQLQVFVPTEELEFPRLDRVDGLSKIPSRIANSLFCSNIVASKYARIDLSNFGHPYPGELVPPHGQVLLQLFVASSACSTQDSGDVTVRLRNEFTPAIVQNILKNGSAREFQKFAMHTAGSQF